MYIEYPTGLEPFSNHMTHSSFSNLELNEKDKLNSHIGEILEIERHQIFLGMVSTQYQVQSDVIQLIESLDRACIRFVHFSKENELRSRVFSEKMGLESGWNCHISLLEDNSCLFSPEKKVEEKGLIVDLLGTETLLDLDSTNCKTNEW